MLRFRRLTVFIHLQSVTSFVVFHSTETGFGYGVWLHGEAVGAGMVMAADLSSRMGWIPKMLMSRLVNLLRRCDVPTDLSGHPHNMTPEKFYELMSLDKKVENGKLKLVLLKGRWDLYTM